MKILILRRALKLVFHSNDVSRDYDSCSHNILRACKTLYASRELCVRKSSFFSFSPTGFSRDFEYKFLNRLSGECYQLCRNSTQWILYKYVKKTRIDFVCAHFYLYAKRLHNVYSIIVKLVNESFANKVLKLWESQNMFKLCVLKYFSKPC